jgi:hypothetical protein
LGRFHHAASHCDCNLKREVDPFGFPLGHKTIEPAPVGWRPRWGSVFCIEGGNGLDPLCGGRKIPAKEILFKTRFKHGFSHVLQGLAAMLFLLLENGESRVNGFRTGIEIAPLGHPGELLQKIYGKRIFNHIVIGIGNDIARNRGCVCGLLEGLAGPGGALNTAREFEERLALHASLGGLCGLAAPVERRDKFFQGFIGWSGWRSRLPLHRRSAVQKGTPTMSGAAIARFHV